jgi:hypothetical protein
MGDGTTALSKTLLIEAERNANLRCGPRPKDLHRSGKERLVGFPNIRPNRNCSKGVAPNSFRARFGVMCASALQRSSEWCDSSIKNEITIATLKNRSDLLGESDALQHSPTRILLNVYRIAIALPCIWDRLMALCRVQ